MYNTKFILIIFIINGVNGTPRKIDHMESTNSRCGLLELWFSLRTLQTFSLLSIMKKSQYDPNKLEINGSN